MNSEKGGRQQDLRGAVSISVIFYFFLKLEVGQKH